MTISEENAGTKIDLNKGDILEVTLEGNPSTGYSWLLGSEVSLLEPVGEPVFEPASNLVGSPGKITMRFNVVEKGEGTLQLVYQRPWERNIPPIATFEITVVIQ